MIPRKKGGQPGNKNAIGNKGGAPHGNRNSIGHGAPYNNQNSVTHGLYSNTGIYAKKPLNYEALSIEDKAIVNELIKDYGESATVDTLFRVIKFENNLTPLYALRCKNPYGALWYSTKLLLRECGNLWT